MGVKGQIHVATTIKLSDNPASAIYFLIVDLWCHYILFLSYFAHRYSLTHNNHAQTGEQV